MTPQDVCPSIRLDASLDPLDPLELPSPFLVLGDEFEPSFDLLELSAVSIIRKADYGYTFSMTIRHTKHWCHTVDPYGAAESCNIFFLEGIVMLYKTAPDRARFFFFAEREYLEKYSGEFEMPTN